MKKLKFLGIFLFFTSQVFCAWFPGTSTVTSNSTSLEYLTPELAMNPSGYTVAVWGFYDDTLPACSAQTAFSTDFGKNWSSAVSVGVASPTNRNTRPKVVLDSSNRAIMIWQRFTAGGVYEVLASPCGASPTNVSTLDPTATDNNSNPPRPSIAMDNSGHAIATWTTGTAPGSFYTSYKISSDYGNSWPITPPVTLDPLNPSAPGTFPKVIMDNSGHAIIIWVSGSGGAYVTKLVSSSDYGASWSAVKTLDAAAPLSTTETYLSIAMDESGHVVACWLYESGFFYVKTAYSLDYGDTWSAATNLDPTNPSNEETIPQIGLDASGHAIVIWQRQIPAGTMELRTSKSSNYGETWTVPIVINTTAASWMAPEIAVGEGGNAVAVWLDELGPNLFNVEGESTTDYGTSWTHTQLATNVSPGGFFTHTIRARVAIQGNANAANGLAIWTDFVPAPPLSSTFVNQYQLINLPGTGKQEELNAFLQIDLINRIQTLSLGLKGTYRLYKDIGLTQFVDSVTTSGGVANLIDHHVKKGESYTYYLTWTDEFGNRTGPITIPIN